MARSNRWTAADLASVGAKHSGAKGVQPKKPTFRIGIDPGNNTGFAVWNEQESRFQVIETVDFWSAYGKVGTYPIDETMVVVEVPRGKNNWTGDTQQITTLNVGGVIREANLLAEGLRRKGYSVKEVHPRGKVDADGFKRLTGYQGRTNEHNRDAGMLAMIG